MIRVSALFWLALQINSPEVVQHLHAGAEAEKQQHFDSAITEYKQVTELAPASAEGFATLGQAYMENREFATAIPALKHAVELDPEMIPAHRLLGYALLAQGYASESIPHLQKAQEQGAVGIAQIQTGDFADAVANLQVALSKRPNDPDLLYYLGRAGGLLSKRSIDTLMDLYPDSPRAHQALGENYYVLRQMPEAEKEYRAALQKQLDTPGVHLELGEVYAGASQWAKAEEEFRLECKLQPGNPEAAYRLGSALLQQGKGKEARAELVRADRLKPEMPETLYALGKANSLEGNAAEAEKAWTDLLKIEDDTPLAAQAHFGLAALYRKQGKKPQADHELQEYQKLQTPRDPPTSVSGQ